MISSNDIKLGNQINAGNHIVSVGIRNTTDIAIISKTTGRFVKFKDIKKGGVLWKIKRNKKFKIFLCSDNDFCFSWMQDDMAIDLINLLRRK
jgi:hypothetical protein